jgi:hypothetical protein
VLQTLAAQPPVAGTGFLPGFGGLDSGGTGAPTTGQPSDLGSYGGGAGGFGSLHSPGGLVPGGSPSTASPAPRMVLAAVPYRDWLVFGYGAWGCAVLAALCLWGLAIHRRRLGGVL